MVSGGARDLPGDRCTEYSQLADPSASLETLNAVSRRLAGPFNDLR